MKFSNEMNYHKIPEWSSQYIDYRSIKKLLKSSADSPLQTSLLLPSPSSLILSEAFKVNIFFLHKLKEFQNNYDTILYYLYSLRRLTSLGNAEVQSMLTVYDLDDAENRATSMQRAFIELHMHVSWLEMYCEINYIAFTKLFKKIEDNALKDTIGKLDFCKWSESICELKLRMYTTLADECLGGDKEKAKRMVTCYRYLKNIDLACISFCIGIMIVMAAVIFFMIIDQGFEKTIPSLCFFRLFYSVSFLVLMASWVVYFLDLYSVGWLYLFDISPCQKVSYVQIVKFSLCLLTFCMVMTALNLSTIFYYPIAIGNLIPLLLSVVILLLLVLPYNVNRHGRYVIGNSILHVICAPIGQTRFTQYMTGCWLTSLIIPLKDIYLCLDFYFSQSWITNNYSQGSTSVLIAISCLPFLLRILQNIKRVFYKWSLLLKQAGNCIRYAISIVIMLTAYEENYKGYVWIIGFIAGTLVLAYYDVRHDWQIKFKVCGLQCQNRAFPVKFYYFAAFSNTFLRFAGVASLLPIKVFTNEWIHGEILVFVLALLEIFRKCIWSVIRVERERSDNKEHFRNFDYIPKKTPEKG